jgi:recombinational DNA repair ATPase RecF
MSLVRKDRGEPPLFLMDDFDTDVDEIRATALASYLNEGGFQAVVATSKEKMADSLGVPFLKVRMDEGVARVA